MPAAILDGKDIIAVLRNPTSAVSPHKFIWHYCGENVTAGKVDSRQMLSWFSGC
jgi:hypothetical protein